MNNHLIALLAVAGALAPLAAHADRPLATEDADVLPARDCEWESFAARQTASGTDAVKAWATQVGCGIGFRTEVALAFSRASSAGLRSDAWTLGGKTALVTRNDDSLGLTLAWGLSTLKAPGGSFKHEDSMLNLVATKQLVDGLTGHANLGWTRSQSTKQSSTTWNLAADYSLAGGVDLVGEVYGDDRAKPWPGAGLRWAATERLTLDALYSVQNETPKLKLLALGFKLAF